MKSSDKRPQQGSQGKGEPQQQQQPPQGGEGKQYGEGNYKATRDYNAGLKEHVEHHDIDREARDAAPRSEAEAREMEQAERLGRSKSRGEGASPDGGASDEENRKDIQK